MAKIPVPPRFPSHPPPSPFRDNPSRGYIYICTFECMHYPRFSSDRFVNIGEDGEEISCSRIIGNFYLRGVIRIVVEIAQEGEGMSSERISYSS